ncbi:hypothetical protein ETAA8_19300 [Anatilimnocola aggregata]|uniref:Uncharacterized protein n=1 Tax=Anatilimnocola aggregata TaxID=2528021 RepID=A0A517Y9E8_9BACT|nr:hypothetical protein [Anatilimnocola aggregata]QDU26846.1 hypothetical protein ETAA8_19300 [Anatilimnocola aggregata]
MTDPVRSRPWYRLQFNLGTLLWLMLVIGMAIAWWNDRQRFEVRLQKLEQTYAPAAQSLWGAADILGAPDDPTGTAGKSWCPLGSNGADWVEVGFNRAVAASTIDLYETYAVGCVKEVLVVDRAGNETSIWKGTDPTPAAARTGLFRVPVPKSLPAVQRVKIHVDSVGKSPWPCLDAVGLTSATGKTVWATSSACSSVYGNSSLTASSQQSKWQGFW